MTDDNTEFDFQKALKGIQEGKPFTGKDGVLTSLIKNIAEAALEAELDSHLGQEVSANRRNGKTRKTIKSLNGNFKLETPRVFNTEAKNTGAGRQIRKTSGSKERVREIPQKLI